MLKDVSYRCSTDSRSVCTCVYGVGGGLFQPKTKRILNVPLSRVGDVFRQWHKRSTAPFQPREKKESFRFINSRLKRNYLPMGRNHQTQDNRTESTFHSTHLSDSFIPTLFSTCFSSPPSDEINQSNNGNRLRGQEENTTFRMASNRGF